ncbi:MAG: hypothetical protein ACYTGG_06195 [Planctomycetota bacterium]|jgi:hypothetical protein
MPLTLSQLVGIVVVMIAVAFAAFSLGVIGSELENAIRRLRLREEASRLREEQARRLSELAAENSTRRRARSAPPMTELLDDVEILDNPVPVAPAA